MDKVNNHDSFQLLESFGLYNGRYVAFQNHFERLKNSAKYFGFKLYIEEIKKTLLDLANSHEQDQWKIRLLVKTNGEYLVDIQEISTFTNKLKAHLAHSPVDKNNQFLYHKTTNRHIYEEQKQVFPNYFDVLLFNERNELTEFTIGNVVLEINNEKLTPFISSGLLAGTYRKQLLDEGIIKERKLTIKDLDRCTNIWLINSVRKWVPIILEK